MTIAVGQPARAHTDRIFFTAMAGAAGLVMFIGFAPSYFLRVATLPPLTLLYQLHGALFVTWIGLFMTQTALVAGRRADIHRKLGVIGAVVAALVFILGVTVSVETLRRGGGFGDPRSFFAIPMGDILVFGVLATAAVILRRRSDWHKRLMLLATISLLTAAVARFLAQIHAGGAVGLFLGTDIFVLIVMVYDFVSRGRIHPATLWGAGAVVVFKPLFFALAGTPPWLALADSLR